MPQLFMLLRTKEVDTLTSSYIFALGGYRYAPSHCTQATPHTSSWSS